MNALKKKNYIKIPNDIEVYCHCDSDKILFKTPFHKSIVNLKVRVTYLMDPMRHQKVLYVTEFPFKNDSTKSQKKLQGLTTSCIKKELFKMSGKVCVKLKLVGVGYKALIIKQAKDTILQLKLGYSHNIYLKLPSDIDIKIIKSNKLFIFGNSFEKVSSISALIRSYKAPEPYKGKGILYVNESIQLKIGKKV